MASPPVTREQRARLYWDADPTGAFPSWEIGRILTFGTLAEVSAAVLHYGRDAVEDALATNRSIPADVAAFWRRFGLPSGGIPVHPETLPTGAVHLLARLAPIARPYGFMLCGGTAVALRLGHRASEDLDLFTPDPFDVEGLAAALQETASAVSNEQRGRNTWHGMVDGTRVSCIRQAGVRMTSDVEAEGLPLADVETLAALKLNAVAGRGERKDFIDVYALCLAGWTVSDLVRISRARMPGMNDAHLLRSLTYFEDAERSPMPAMRQAISWGAVRRFFEHGVRAHLAAPDRA